MKNVSMVATLALSVLLLSAATANAASGAATVQIVNAIAISNLQGLSFGQIIGGSGASVVTVDPDGTRTLTSGDATLAGGTVRAASFAVTGGIGSAYTISLPASVTLTGPGAATLTVSSVTSNPTGAGGVLNGSGQQTLLVGGVLGVPAGPPAAGIYSGNFDVTVVYN